MSLEQWQFSAAMISALEFYMKNGTDGFQNALPTIHFMKDINKWIQMLDISSTN